MGAILLAPEVLPEVERFIGPMDLTLECVRKAFKGAQELRDEGTPIDEVSLYRKARISPLNASRFADYCASPVTVGVHARALRAAAAQKRLEFETQAIAGDAYADRVSLDEAIARLQAIRLEDAEATRSVSAVVRDLSLTLELRHKNKGGLLGFTTGYSEIDTITNGWQAGELTILAARPAMGKTALALNFIHHALRANKQVLVFSLEMSAESLVQRMFSIGGVEANKLKSGHLSGADFGRINNEVALIANGKLVIDDMGGLTLDKLLAKVRSAHQAAPLDFVVIDYLQLMQGAKTNNPNREREVAEISRGLKMLARELKIPVLALAQLNRGVEGRGNKRPGLADLRESGAIEQDADVVMFIYREEVYDAETADKGIAEIIVSKNRNGEIGVARLAFRGAFQRFESKGS